MTGTHLALAGVALVAAVAGLALVFSTGGDEAPAAPEGGPSPVSEPSAHGDVPPPPAPDDGGRSTPPEGEAAPALADRLRVHWATPNEARCSWASPLGSVTRRVQVNEKIELAAAPPAVFVGGRRNADGRTGGAEFDYAGEVVSLQWELQSGEAPPELDDPPPFPPPPDLGPDGPDGPPPDDLPPPPPEFDPEKDEDRRRRDGG